MAKKDQSAISESSVAADSQTIETVAEEKTPGTVLAEIKEEAKEVEAEVVEFVTVTVPRAFKLTLDHFRTIDIKAGIQEMEKSWAEHWYSKANGVEVYDPKAKAPVQVEQK